MLLVVAATEPELRGLPADDRVEPLACGVGPVDAAATTAARLARGGVTAVLHVGIAGCRRASEVQVGDVVVGSASSYDDSTSRLVVRSAQPDQRLVEAAAGALPGCRCLPIGTAADVGGTTGCDVEAMEGFAVLRAAQLAGVPAVEVRVIANEVEEPDRSLWEFGAALATLESALPRLVSRLTT